MQYESIMSLQNRQDFNAQTKKCVLLHVKNLNLF